MKLSSILIVTILVIFICICCFCMVGLTTGAFYLFNNGEKIVNQIPTGFLSPTPTVVINRPPVDSVPTFTRDLLKGTTIPENDLADLSCRLLNKCGIPATVVADHPRLEIDELQQFWVSNSDTNENRRVTASLRVITEHVYFWVEQGVEFDASQLTELTNTFEASIYTTTREYFGDEWSPGVDGDQHIYILYARGLGDSIAGVFSTADEYNPLLHEFSNGHEMFVFNADNSFLDDPYTYGVLAHEFQHMTQWNVDRNESSWLNEGFSELSSFINGYDQGGFDYLYDANTDLQLNVWPNDQDAVTPNYGSSFLFTAYFMDRFGKNGIHALVANPLNGLESVDDTLVQIKATDPITQNPITADDLVLDWALTNILLDPDVSDGRYDYHNYDQAVVALASESIFTCPRSSVDRPVNQYGVDYIKIACAGDYTLHFEGSTIARLLPEDPFSGSYAFWSNKGDEAGMTLTREFDLSPVNGPVSLTYRTWFDIETDFDYLYMEVSEDGEHWKILQTPSGTLSNPNGNSLGWAYTGITDGWIEERIDLSDYAGKEIFIRFEYVTDGAVNGEGFLLDDISIPVIGYLCDFENDGGGWIPKGFARIQNSLPQTFRLGLIKHGTHTSIEEVILNSDLSVDIPLHIGGDTQSATLVVIGTTRLTQQLASYRYEILK